MGTLFGVLRKPTKVQFRVQSFPKLGNIIPTTTKTFKETRANGERKTRDTTTGIYLFSYT